MKYTDALVEDILREHKKHLIEEILEGLKRLPDSKASFALIEEWEGRKND